MQPDENRLEDVFCVFRGERLAPTPQYQVYLVESDRAPFGKLEPLAILKTNPDGAGIVQSIRPLETLVGGTGAAEGAASSRRFLIFTEFKSPSRWYCGDPRALEPDIIKSSRRLKVAREIDNR